MNRKFLISFTFLAVLLCAAYDISYRFGMSAVPEGKSTQTEASLSAVNAGNPDKVYHYYLTEENGAVSVYLDDRTTLYEYTTIKINSLPSHLQEEIRKGKFLEGDRELYDFLENYSS